MYINIVMQSLQAIDFKHGYMSVAIDAFISIMDWIIQVDVGCYTLWLIIIEIVPFLFTLHLITY